MYIPEVASIPRSPTLNVNDPSNTKNDSSIPRCRCGTVQAPSPSPKNSAKVKARSVVPARGQHPHRGHPEIYRPPLAWHHRVPVSRHDHRHHLPSTNRSALSPPCGSASRRRLPQGNIRNEVAVTSSGRDDRRCVTTASSAPSPEPPSFWRSGGRRSSSATCSTAAQTFTEIQQGAPGIPTALLTQRLDALRAARRPRAHGQRDRPGRTYRLTEMGQDLRAICDAMGQWGARWLEIEPRHLDPAYVLWATASSSTSTRSRWRRPWCASRCPTARARHTGWSCVDLDPSSAPRAPATSRTSSCRTDAATLVDLHLRRTTYAEALRSGRLDPTAIRPGPERSAPGSAPAPSPTTRFRVRQPQRATDPGPPEPLRCRSTVHPGCSVRRRTLADGSSVREVCPRGGLEPPCPVKGTSTSS